MNRILLEEAIGILVGYLKEHILYTPYKIFEITAYNIILTENSGTIEMVSFTQERSHGNFKRNLGAELYVRWISRKLQTQFGRGTLRKIGLTETSDTIWTWNFTQDGFHGNFKHNLGAELYARWISRKLQTQFGRGTLRKIGLTETSDTIWTWNFTQDGSHGNFKHNLGAKLYARFFKCCIRPKIFIFHNKNACRGIFIHSTSILDLFIFLYSI